jgi:hypothetical protein
LRLIDFASTYKKYASAHRSSRASPLDLFEQPAESFSNRLFKMIRLIQTIRFLNVIPAQAGIQGFVSTRKSWMPAFAGMTDSRYARASLPTEASIEVLLENGERTAASAGVMLCI